MNRIRFQVYRDNVLQEGYTVWVGTTVYGTESTTGYPTHNIAPGSYDYVLRLDIVIAKTGVMEIPIVPEGELYTIRFDIEQSPQPPPPPTQPNPSGGEEPVGDIGTSCTLIHLYGGTFDKYLYESKITGQRSQQYDEHGSAEYYGNLDPICQQVIAPTPTPVNYQTQIDDLNAEVDSLGAAIPESTATAIQTAESYTDAIVLSVLDSVTKTIDSVNTQLDTLWSIELPLIWDTISEILAAAEEEAAAWRKAIEGIEDSIKTWITEMALEILLTNMMSFQGPTKKQGGK